MRVCAPNGDSWEIYAYRVRLGSPPWPEPGLAFDDPVGVTPWTAAEVEMELGVNFVDGLLWLLGLIPRFLRLLTWELPLAVWRAHSTGYWYVEARTWYPTRSTLLWVTDAGHRRAVTASVAAALQGGDQPHPDHARPVRIAPD